MQPRAYSAPPETKLASNASMLADRDLRTTISHGEFLLVVETLGDAFAAGWRITARCAWGKREGMKSKRECHYTRELDLETLVWTRGPNFPLSSLDGRLMCPRCKSRRVVVMFQPPTVSKSAKA